MRRASRLMSVPGGKSFIVGSAGGAGPAPPPPPRHKITVGHSWFISGMRERSVPAHSLGAASELGSPSPYFSLSDPRSYSIGSGTPASAKARNLRAHESHRPHAFSPSR